MYYGNINAMRTSKTNMAKVALIGYGYWGKKIYKALKSLYGENAIVVVDPKEKKTKNKALKFTTLTSILNNLDISHVFIATPEETHYEVVKKCLNHKKNVFVEKPLCLNSQNAQELVAMAKKNSLTLYVDYIFEHDLYTQKIIELITNKVIGRLKHIKSIRHSINIHKPNVSVADDLAIHDIYLGSLFFKKDINQVKAICEVKKSAQTLQQSVTYFFDKETLSAHYSWIQPYAERKIIFIGSDGSLVWDKNIKNILYYKNQELVKEYKIKPDTSSALQRSISYFFTTDHKHTQTYENDIKVLEMLH